MESKRKTGIKVDYVTDAGQRVITWTDIEAKAEPIRLVVDDLSEDIRNKAVLHGLDQKVTDAGAMGTDHWDGEDKPKRAATTAERLARMRRVADNLVAGQWNVRVSADPLANKTAEQLATLIAAAQAKLKAIGVSGM
jgi:hypothetical protein